MFQYEVWPPSAGRHLVHQDNFVDNCYNEKGKVEQKTLTVCISLFLSGVSVVYSMALCRWWLYIIIETFLTFNFDPSLISELITDYDLEKIYFWI